VDLKEVRCGGHGLHLSGSDSVQVSGACDYGDEHPGSIKYREFLTI